MSKRLIQAMSDLDESIVLEEVKLLISSGTAALDIIALLQEGMELVGKRFEAKEYFLTELIMSAIIFNEASKIIGSEKEGEAVSKYGTFVMGTIYDDIHNIGKDIVTTVMSNSGFHVIDLGVDVPTAKFIEAIRGYKPKVIGISCLLTTCFDNVRECISAIEAAGLRDGLKVLIGGSPVDEATCKYVKADHVCKNAQQTVGYCMKYMDNIS